VSPSEAARPASEAAAAAAGRPAAEEPATSLAAGAHGIHCLPVPTPFAVGRVNCYLVEDDPLTLVDAGPNSATSLTALEGALAEHEHKVEDLERIVVTHQHIDHIGLVAILAERSGAEVCALDRLAPWLADYRKRMDADDAFSTALMLRNGIPEEVTYALRAVSASFRAWGAAAQVTRPLQDGELLQFAERSWRVCHRPGHSPSDTIFHDEGSGELIGGDHLIKHISSNPLIALPLEDERDAERQAVEDPVPRRPRALRIYIDSLRRTAEMDLTVVLSGHGEPIADHRTLIDERLRMHERRASKLLRLIAEQPRNAYELAQAMWGNVAVTQAFLTLSEVLGHVDLLIDEGKVAERERDGVVYFEASRGI
jgi:glyoxylase-like metal-dependent hydrolase (beta-lactamase superfamily II)